MGGCLKGFNTKFSLPVSCCPMFLCPNPVIEELDNTMSPTNTEIFITKTDILYLAFLLYQGFQQFGKPGKSMTLQQPGKMREFTGTKSLVILCTALSRSQIFLYIFTNVHQNWMELGTLKVE